MVTRRQLCQQGIWLGIGFSWHTHASLLQPNQHHIDPALPLTTNIQRISPLTQYRLAIFQERLGQYFFIADGSGQYSKSIQLVEVKSISNKKVEQFLLRFRHSDKVSWAEQIYDMVLAQSPSELASLQLLLSPVHGALHYLDATITHVV